MSLDELKAGSAAVDPDDFNALIDIVAASSGGVPDPSGEPDGDVLTVASGAAVWAPGGSSQPTKQEEAEGSAQVSIAAGDSAPLPWEYVQGDVLLDYSVPTAPTFIEAGTYAVTAAAICADSPSIGWYELQIGIDAVAPYMRFDLADPGWSLIMVVGKALAEAPLVASVVNHHATDALHFALQAVYIVKLA